MKTTTRNLMLAGALLLLGAGTANAQVLINEVDADQTGTDAAEFVELYNAGGSAVDLAAGGFVLVFYNGSNDQSYYSVDLTGSIPAGGYYLVGNAGVVPAPTITFADNFLQNGQDAVALYSGTSAASFPNTTPVTATGLVDALVYDTDDADDAELLPVLTPGQPQVNENGGTFGATQSMQRIPDGAGGAMNTSSYQTATPTPGAANSAPATPAATVNVASIDFGRFNATNVGMPSDRTVRITNTGGGTLNVTTFELDGASDSVFSVGAPSVGLPAMLTAGQNVEIIVSYENAVAATDTFTGAINYATDDPGNMSGSVPLAAEFVAVVQTASAGDVVINEICSDPLPTAGVAQDYNGDGTGSTTDDEFVELYNSTGAAINIQGWELAKTLPSQTTYIFPVGTMIPANGHIAVFGGGTPTGFPAGTTFTFGLGLNNAGAELALSDGTTTIDDIAFGDQEGLTVGVPAAGVLSDGGSIGRATDASPTWIEFAFDAAAIEDRPNPVVSNGTVPTAAGNWEVYN